MVFFYFLFWGYFEFTYIKNYHIFYVNYTYFYVLFNFFFNYIKISFQ